MTGAIFLSLYFILVSGILILFLLFVRKAVPPLQNGRLLVQIVAVLLLNFGIFTSFPLLTPFLLPILNCRDFVGAFGSPTLVCSFGLFQRSMTLSLWFAMTIPIIVIGLIFLVFLIAGRALCGWACPVGLISDTLTGSRVLCKKNAREFSKRAHNNLKLLKYALLLLVIILSLSVGSAVYSDPVVGSTYKASLPGEAHKESWCLACPAPLMFIHIPDTITDTATGHLILTPLAFLSIILFGVLLIGAVAMPRFMCRYVCPLGAMGAGFNKVSMLHIKKDVEKCTQCGTCRRNCPMRIERVYNEKKVSRVSDPECVYCMSCVNGCPEKALSLRFGNAPVYKGGRKT